MPFPRPLLTELRDEAAQDVTANLLGGDGLLRDAVLLQLSWTQAGFAHGHYGYLDWIARQAVPFTATEEFLEGWAALKGVLRKPATAAAVSVTFSGLPGAVIPAGTVAARSDGLRYATQEELTLPAAGAGAVTLVAEEPGSAGNVANAVRLSLLGSIAGVANGGISSGTLLAGADQETDDAFRTRMLEVYRAPPQGGSAADYRTWALEVPGVTRAWVAPNAAGAGSVVVRVMLDDAHPERQGLPVGTNGAASDEPRAPAATGDQLAVADYISQRRPVTALVRVLAPVAAPVAVEVRDMDGNTAAIRDAVRLALLAMLRREAAPGGTIDASAFYAAVDGVPGVERFTLVRPAGPVAVDPAGIATLGALSFT